MFVITGTDAGGAYADLAELRNGRRDEGGHGSRAWWLLGDASPSIGGGGRRQAAVEVRTEEQPCWECYGCIWSHRSWRGDDEVGVLSMMIMDNTPTSR